MSRIFQLPKQVPIVGGTVSAGCKANFYLTGTSTPTNTYTDSALTTPHANPVVADSSGIFATIYLNPQIVYKLTLNDSTDTLIYTEDPIQDALTQANIGFVLYPRTAAEIAAGVTPTSYQYEPGDPRRIATVASSVITINVPTDVATLQEAFDLFGTPVPGGVLTKINIESGHQPATGLYLNDGYYKHMQIDHADFVTVTGDADGSTAVITNIADTSSFAVNDKVFINKGFDGYGGTDGAGFTVLSKTSTSLTIDANSDEVYTSVYISKAVTLAAGFTGIFIELQHAVGPELNVLFNMNGLGTYGLEVNRASEISVATGCGMINSAGLGLEVRGSRFFGVNTFWGGAGDVGIRYEQTATGTMNECNVDNCLGSGTAGAVFVSRGCSINIMFASVCNAGKGRDGLSSTANAYGIEVRRSIAACTSSDFSGAVSHGIFARHTALVGARDSKANNCGGTGYRAEDASIVGAKGGSATACNAAVWAITGGTVDANGLTATGHTGNWAIRTDSGGQINCDDATTDAGSPGLADIEFAPNVLTGKGITFADSVTNDIATGTYTIDVDYPATEIDSTGGAVTGTLGSGPSIGFIKTIVMTNAANSSTVNVSLHETTDPEVITFAAVDDTAVLMWTGTEWITIKLSGATV